MGCICRNLLQRKQEKIIILRFISAAFCVVQILNKGVLVTVSSGVTSCKHLVQKRCENTRLRPVSRNQSYTCSDLQC